MKFFLPLILLFYTERILCASEYPLYFSLGVLTSSLGKVVTVPTGKKTLISEIYPTFNVSTDWHFLRPSMVFTILGRTLADNAGTAYQLFFNFPLFFKLKEKIELRGGPGLLFYIINGHGGTVELGNGTGTNPFATPSNTSFAKIFVLDFGISFLTDLKVDLDLDSFILDALSVSRGIGFLAQVRLKVL